VVDGAPGAETLLHSLLRRAERDLAMGMNALQVLKLDPALRTRASACLIPPASGNSKMKVPHFLPTYML
jgi:hypothetical protein